MERLTYFDNGKWRIKIGDTEYSGEAVDRLSAYEDTGLEPEKIELLAKQRDLYVDACGELPLKRIRELAQADREGRCVVLPESYYTALRRLPPGKRAGRQNNQKGGRPRHGSCRDSDG